MIYISEARLTRAARHLTRDPYAMHRTLTFALQQPTVHWANPAPDVLIIQAPTPLRPETVPGIVDYIAARPKPVDFARGTRVELAGLINPVAHRRTYPPGWQPTDPRPKTRRQALPPERWDEWARRLLGDTLHIEHLDMQHHAPTNGRKPGHRITTVLAALHAVGTVRDPAALAAILTGGLGHAKSMGAGLILCKELT